MKLQDFTGGLNTRLRPQYLTLNQGVEYENIDNSLGSLAPVKSPTDSGIAVERFATFFNAKQEWVSSDTRKDYVEFQSTLYSTDSSSLPTKYDGTSTQLLGIVAPAVAPTATTTPTIDPGKQVRVTATTGNLPDEELFYRLVVTSGPYYSKSTDFSFNPGTGETTKPTIAKKINLDSPEIGVDGLSFTSGVIVENIDDVACDLYRMYKGKWRYVLSLDSVGPNPADLIYDISGNQELVDSGIPPIVGDMQYVYTFYNSTEGVESAPSPASALLEDVVGQVDLALAVSSDPQVTNRRIYRIGGDLTTFSLVAEIDNTILNYSDTTANTSIIGTVLSTQTNNPPPGGMQGLVEAYAILFAADGDKLRFSDIGKPDAWPVLNFLQFDQPITGIAPVSNGIIVMTKFRSFIVTGTSAAQFSQELLSGDQGCIDFSSVQYIGASAIWASSDGICASNGNDVKVLSADTLGNITLSPVDSVVHDEAYYLLESTGSILVYDYKYGGIFKRLNLAIDSLAQGTDKLYGHAAGKLQELFAGSTYSTFSYVSPRFIEGRASEEKTYKNIYIYAKGDIILNILINDDVVMTKTLTGEKGHTVSVPQEKQRGYFLQFSIAGTGEVYEIEYVAGRGHGQDG